MEEKILKCDCCKKQSSDICGDVGWISIDASTPCATFNIGVSDGRAVDGCHKSKFWKGSLEKLDFCSVDCMLKWIGVEKESKKVVEYDIREKIFELVELFDRSEDAKAAKENVLRFSEIRTGITEFNKYIVLLMGIGRK